MNRNETIVGTDFLANGGSLVNRVLYEVAVEALSPDPDQPRKYFDDHALDELKVSIDRHGVLQPVIFRKAPQGRLLLVSGERRFRAAQLAGKTTIPAIYNEDGNAAEIALVENLLRENLNPIEEAEALKRLKDAQSYTNAQLSVTIGKAESTISEILSLNRLPESVKTECRASAVVSRRALVEIAKAGGDERMEKLFEDYRKKELKGDDLRTTTRKAKEPSKQWLRTIADFSEKLAAADFEGFGDERGTVEEALRALNLAIAGKLS